MDEIWLVGAAMLALLAAQALSTLFVDYQGHVMGAKMEGAMRQELFEHYQSLSFGFYDRQRVGQLMPGSPTTCSPWPSSITTARRTWRSRC